MRPPQRPLSPGWVAGSVRARHMLARRLGRGRVGARPAPVARRGAGALAGSAYGRALPPGHGPRRRPARGRGDDALARARARGLDAAARRSSRSARSPPGSRSPTSTTASPISRGADGRRRSSSAASSTRGRASPGAQSAGELRAVLVGHAVGRPGHRRCRRGSRWRCACRGRRRVLDAVDGGGGVGGRRRRAAAGPRAAARRPAGRRALSARARPASDRAGRRRRRRRGAARGACRPRRVGPRGASTSRPSSGAAEGAWWRRVEADAERLARSAHLGRRGARSGSVVLLGVDAWRTAAALEAAARGGRGVGDGGLRGPLPDAGLPAPMSRVALVAPESRLRAMLVVAGRVGERRARRAAAGARGRGGRGAAAPGARRARASRRAAPVHRRRARRPRAARARGDGATSWPARWSSRAARHRRCAAGGFAVLVGWAPSDALPGLSAAAGRGRRRGRRARRGRRSWSRRRCCARSASRGRSGRSWTPTARRATPTSTRRRSRPSRSWSCSG